MNLLNLRADRPIPMNLATWLGGGSVLIVLVSLGLMALACSLLVSRLVEAQALARAEFAVTSAREALRRVGEDRLTDARVLAERPTLRRLLAEDDLRGLDGFLRRYCYTSRAEVCAVLGPGGPVLTAGPAVPWDAVAQALSEQGERFSLAPRDGGAVLFGASAPVVDMPGLRAVTVSRADGALLGDIGRELGAAVVLMNFATYTAPDRDPLTPLHSLALAGAAPAAQFVPALDAYVGSMVVANPVGERVGLLEARLPAVDFRAQTRRFRVLLALATALVALGAGVGGWLFGKRLARPVTLLGDAAQQIGRGDFSAAIPVAGPREVATLGQTMDDMRRNLVELVDALRRREAEMRIARRARDAVLGNISHEFRTPLAAQLASIELLRDGLERLDPPAQRELLSNVERGVRRLMHLIDNLLESVRIESGQLSIRHQSVFLLEFVRDAAEWMLPLLKQRGRDLGLELGDEPCVVVGDRQRLVQVLVNLLSNASKFAPEKSLIRIGGEPRDGRFALWVEDEGPGFPDADPAPLFERFRRGTGEEPDAPGLGLGLAIVKSIVERHDGGIVAERTTSGRTRFTLTLPLEDDA